MPYDTAEHASWNRRNWVMWWTHLCKHLVKPLERSIKMDFNPAWCTSYILTMIFCSPTLHKTHSDSAHFSKVIHCLKAMVDRLAEQSCKLLIIKYFKGTPRRYFAHCGRMKAMVVVAIPALYEDATVTKTFSKYFPSNVVQVNSWNIPSDVNNILSHNLGRQKARQSKASVNILHSSYYTITCYLRWELLLYTQWLHEAWLVHCWNKHPSHQLSTWIKGLSYKCQAIYTSPL